MFINCYKMKNGEKMKRIFVVCTIICIAFSVIQSSIALTDKHTSRNFEIKGMSRCNITIEGNGYSSWLSGMSMDGMAFISVALIDVKEGITTISSIKNPDEKYTFTGKQLVFMVGYAGQYYSSHEYIPYIIYNGSALKALVIAIE